jgi:hypothetical protein
MTEHTLNPLWGDARQVAVLFGLSPRRLRQLLETGGLRSLKLGKSRASRRLYRIQDVDRALVALAEGRAPHRQAVRRSRIPEGAEAGTV